jgi:putative ABC transport system permease protein
MPDSVLRRSENVGFNAPPQPRVSVRLKTGNLAANINVLKTVWKTISPTQDFDYVFLDDTIARQYEAEQRTSSIVKIASAISIFIACMGLFGLATLAVLRRTKEIGIRKILGASVSSVVKLLSKDFLKLVFIASVIAFPLAWWFLDQWLKDFAYRVNISWWVFVLAGLSAMVIALLTISFQAVKAAVANPVKSLRTE